MTLGRCHTMRRRRCDRNANGASILSCLVGSVVIFYFSIGPLVAKGGFRRGTRPGDTLQILPLGSSATPKPPLYYLPLCAQGTPFSNPPSWFFQGHSVGHSFTKDNNWNCNIFKRKYAFQMKNIKHTHYMYIYTFIVFIMRKQCKYYVYAYSFIYMYIYIYILHTHIYVYICVCVFVCVLKLQKNLKSIVNLSSLQ